MARPPGGWVVKELDDPAIVHTCLEVRTWIDFVIELNPQTDQKTRILSPCLAVHATHRTVSSR